MSGTGDKDGDDNTEQEGEEGDDESQKAALEATALYADAYFLNSWAGHIRIAFGEFTIGKANYRAAFVMELGDAEALATDLATLVKRRRDADGKPE